MAKKPAKKAKKPVARKRLSKPAPAKKLAPVKKPTKTVKESAQQVAAKVVRNLRKNETKRQKEKVAIKSVVAAQQANVTEVTPVVTREEVKASLVKAGLTPEALLQALPKKPRGKRATIVNNQLPKEREQKKARLERQKEQQAPKPEPMQPLPPMETAPTVPSVSTYELQLFDHKGRPFRAPASPQQGVLFDWIQKGVGNAFVEAVAGSGKTTSLTQGCRFMKGSVAMTCFNKKIAQDIEDKLSKLAMKHIKVGTFHSFGWQACRNAYKGVQLEKGRGKNEKMIEAIGLDLTKPHFAKMVGPIVQLVGLAKQSCVMKLWEPSDRQRWWDIIDKHDIGDEFENEQTIETIIDFAIAGVQWSAHVASKIMNFDDMIWVPLVHDLAVAQYDWVLVDEAQDTNPARRLLAERMMKPNGRIIFVGDRHQAIYGFTGADSDAVDILIDSFGCQTLPLTVTYRCPQAVVKEAQKYVKHIVAYEKAQIGSVASLTRTEFWDCVKDSPMALKGWQSLNPSDAILCRLTKPLVSLAFQLIRRQIACHVEGRDIGQGLIALAQRWKVKDCTELHERLEAYLEAETVKLEAKKQDNKLAALQDKIETMYVLMEGCVEIQHLIAKIENLFKDTEGSNRRTVTLSTVHKAKGREWDRVLILGFSKYMPCKWATQAWELEQENNLIYVAITRAMKELVYLEHLEEVKK